MKSTQSRESSACLAIIQKKKKTILTRAIKTEQPVTRQYLSFKTELLSNREYHWRLVESCCLCSTKGFEDIMNGLCLISGVWCSVHSVVQDVVAALTKFMAKLNGIIRNERMCQDVLTVVSKISSFHFMPCFISDSDHLILAR